MKLQRHSKSIMRAVMIALILGLCSFIPDQLPGQGKKSKNDKEKGSEKDKMSAKELREIDSQAKKAKDGFMREYVELALKYESGEQIEKALDLLNSVLELNPSEVEANAIRKKVEELREKTISANAFTMDLDVSRDWGAAGIKVMAGKAFRIQVEGTYKFSISSQLSPIGFSNDDPRQGMVNSVPCGALMGILIPDQPNRPAQAKPDDKPELETLFVGTSLEHSPKKTGRLYFHVNAPQGAKCTGKLKLRISGNAEIISEPASQ